MAAFGLAAEDYVRFHDPDKRYPESIGDAFACRPRVIDDRLTFEIPEVSDIQGATATDFGLHLNRMMIDLRTGGLTYNDVDLGLPI